jgi:hypothetical protein
MTTGTCGGDGCLWKGRQDAVMGKVAGTDENTPPDDDAVTEGDNLANPSAELEYGFYDKATHRPAWVKTRSYTQHYADNGYASQHDFRPAAILGSI